MSDNVLDFSKKHTQVRQLRAVAEMCDSLNKIYDSLSDSYKHLNDMEEAVDKLQDQFELTLKEAIETLGVEEIPEEVFYCSRNMVPVDTDKGIQWTWKWPEDYDETTKV